MESPREQIITHLVNSQSQISLLKQLRLLQKAIDDTAWVAQPDLVMRNALAHLDKSTRDMIAAMECIECLQPPISSNTPEKQRQFERRIKQIKG